MTPRPHERLEHVGIIPDGNRRWAKAKGIDKKQGYRLGTEKLIEMIDLLFEKNIASISIYMMSKENLKRQPEDLIAVLDQISYFYGEGLPRVMQRWNAAAVHAGRLELLPFDGKRRIEAIFPVSDFASAQRRIYLCLAYNPFDELSQALARAQSAEDFWEHLWVPDTVDLVIRTGGDTTLSNFLRLQCGYARIYAIEKLMPDVTTADLDAALQWFYSTARNYGQ